MRFRDRREAGRLLVEKLAFLRGRENLIVLGVPRGGVVVAYEIARALDAPLDVYITRKLGAPYNPELAIGAVTEDGTMILKGNSQNIQKDIFDKNDMILTMSTEETRVVRESASAGVPVVCGRANMHFTKYSEDCIVPSKLAAKIDECHEDLCKNHKW